MSPVSPFEMMAPEPARGGRQPDSLLTTGLRAMRRNLRLIAVTSLVGLLAGLGLVLFSPVTYTATATLSLDKKRVKLVQDAYAFDGEDISLDSELGSQIEILRSRKIARIVAQNLALIPTKTAEPTSQPKPASVLAGFFDSVGLRSLGNRLAGSQSRASAEDLVVDGLRDMVQVRRVGRTSLVEIAYTSSDPDQAARVANAFADAYFEDQRDIQMAATEQAASWLKDRLDELKSTVQETELAIQRYSHERGLVTADGRLIEEQRLADANRQLTAAQTEVANARIRYAQLQTIMKGQASDSVTFDFVSDPIVAQLRSRYLQAEFNERELARKIGTAHDAVSRVRSQKSFVARQLRAELERLDTGLKGQIDIAEAQVEAARKEYLELVNVQSENNAAQIELRELQRRNEAYKGLYSSVLQRYQAAINQQTFNDLPARVLSAARTPDLRNGPSTSRTLAFALVLGAGVGSALAFALGLMDKTLRTRRDALERLGVREAWTVPAVTPRWVIDGSDRRAADYNTDMVGSDGRERQLLGEQPLVLTHAIDNPRSYFAGTFEAIRLAIEGGGVAAGGKTIGVVSVVEGDGASVVAKNLASVMAGAGRRVALIDADLTGGGLSSILTPEVERGIVAVARGDVNAEAIERVEPETGLVFLPASEAEKPRRTTAVAASAGMTALLAATAARHDVVIVDLAPFSRGFDAKALLPALDAVLLVVAWGRTPHALVAETLEREPLLAEKCAGVVLNGADAKALASYGELDPRKFEAA
ncbi:MAG: Wzz/FepE/Etk N-terminal domain-containing protein [Hyphomicrobiaceae bacterium]|nr:Wzz/FepE/Etk N-terminal domain-containing protein [Hyphomicrobiaceae bacterium]